MLKNPVSENRLSKIPNVQITVGAILDAFNHSANGFNEQSHDSGLSFNDSVCNDRVPLNAFRATIDISFPSSRISFSNGNGIIRSDVNALTITKQSKTLTENPKNAIRFRAQSFVYIP